MKRTIKPSSRRVKRILKNLAPKNYENDKKLVFLQGKKGSLLSTNLGKCLGSLKRPNFISLSNKHDIEPFDDHSKLETILKKHDASLVLMTQNTKKRPNTLIFGRLFDGAVLDMFEFCIVALEQALTTTNLIMGSKPYFAFIGELFEYDEDLKLFKNVIVDMFNGPDADQVDLSGEKLMLSFTAVTNTKVSLRAYSTLNGSDLELVQPSADMILVRKYIGSAEDRKLAMEQYTEGTRKVKNVRKDRLGHKIGKVHKGKQDLKDLKLRKGKALRKDKYKPSASQID